MNNRIILLCILILSGTLVLAGPRFKSRSEKTRTWQQMRRKAKLEEAVRRPQDISCSHTANSVDNQKTALQNFYTSTGGSNWLNNKSWLKGDPCVDEWYGVCCNDDGMVIELNLPSNLLVGQLPQFISSFSALQALRLSGNYLTGVIPTDLFLMKTMEVIDLEYNQLEGNLPDKFIMPLLKNLSLSNNKLGGFLPATVWDAPKLQVLSLSTNRFEGTLPKSLTALTALEVLDLSSNFLSGFLPPEYGSLASLKKLWLFENQFNNPAIPSSWLGLRGIENIQMDQLSGELPKLIGTDWPYLQVLILVNGNITGSIPNSVCSLKNLKYLHIFYNNVTGSIPNCICSNSHSSLISIDLSNNLLSGTLPDCLGNLVNLNYIYLDNNGLIGELPESVGNLNRLYSLDLSSNNLFGSIPSSFAFLKASLNELDLSDNKLSGIEDGLEPLFDVVARKSCNLDGNPFSCPIPEYVSGCNNPLCSKCNTGKNHTSCMECVKNEFCGWCSESPNCLDGYSDQPYYPYTCKKGDWFYAKCPTKTT